MQGVAPADAPFGARRRSAAAADFGVQGWCSALAVALLLFLVGYPLLWLVLGALGLAAVDRRSSICSAPSRGRRTTPRSSTRCSSRSAPAS